MLISSSEELRLYSPANAIDHIETIQGFLDSSEQDFLLDKLGQPLYDSLTEYYRTLRTSDDGIATFIQKITDGEPLPPYARLLTIAQRIITFSALGRAIDMQAVSVHGAGVNMGIADDYPKADEKAVQNYKNTCFQEKHAALNRMLELLEQWTKEAANTDIEALDADSDEAVAATEKSEITEKWRSSRYFYLVAGLIIPSAKVLGEYLQIDYDMYEKYILMLPDLRYVQEDIIAPVIGEDFLDYLIEQAQTMKDDDKQMRRIIHKLRKAAARHLEARTKQLRMDESRRVTAHNEAVRLVTDLTEYLQTHQPDFTDALLEAFETSPLYVAPATTEETTDYTPQFENNAEGSVMFVTPALP